MPREYHVIIWEMAGGRPADGAPFSILESSHCTCEVDGSATAGLVFVVQHGYALARAIANQGPNCGVKLLHWGGPNGKSYHASVVGPFDQSLKRFVDEQLEACNLLRHCEIIYFDRHVIPMEEE